MWIHVLAEVALFALIPGVVVMVAVFLWLIRRDA